MQTILDGLSCSSATSCTAVGTYYPQPTPGVGYLPLAEHWDGTRWAIQPTPIPAGSPQAQLSAVSCASATSCTAVGFYYVDAGGNSGPLAEHWNGTRWAIQHVPLPALASGGTLRGVVLPTTSDCTAAGSYNTFNQNTGLFAARWNGTRWTSQVLPHPAGNYFLLGPVSCWQPGRCVAVGGAFNGSTGRPEESIVERQTGTSWALQHDAAPAHTTLGGVACPSARSCTAVGGDVLTWPPPSPAPPWPSTGTGPAGPSRLPPAARDVRRGTERGLLPRSGVLHGGRVLRDARQPYRQAAGRARGLAARRARHVRCPPRRPRSAHSRETA